MTRPLPPLIATFLFVFLCRAFAAEPEVFREWPAGASPSEVGKRVTENYLSRDLYLNSKGILVYPEVCAWYGALTFSRLSGNGDLQARLVKRFDPFLTPKGASMISWRAHVDFRVFGAIPLELYQQTQDARYLKLGRDLADAQWNESTDDGITKEARYWIDDMYMIPLLQVQAYRATGEQRYLERAALTTHSYLSKLQQPNGLFLHAPDSPFYWGRGNGWFAAGMTEMLLALPKDHPRRAYILSCYRKMMAALLATQAEDGLWRQLLERPESWTESSGSAMFAYAFVSGVKNGWLDEQLYGAPARKAWLALVKLLDDKGNLREVCVGTNKGMKEVGPDLKVQLKFYLERARKSGDLHGQSPMLWTASAFLR